MKLNNLTPENINSMDYNQLIGLVKETNRPPGGKESIFQIINRTFLTNNKKVLEIGTSTGFTAIEIAKLIGCNIKAIDINEISLEEAGRRSALEKLNNIEFIKADATNLPFKDSFFDLVFCGNVISLIEDKRKAIEEFKRVLKNNGFIAAIPMYYIERPPKKLLKDVSNAIHVNIKPLKKNYWLDFFNNPELEIYWVEDFYFKEQIDQKIDSFIKDILSKEHLNRLLPKTKMVLKEKYRYFIHLFNRNLSYMGFSIILLRKKNIHDQDPELFVPQKRK